MSASYSQRSGMPAEMGDYDPNRHENQIVALFETRDEAEAAKAHLRQAGIADSAIEVVDRSGGAPGSDTTTERPNDEGFWGALKSLFAPDEDYEHYHTALHRGHAMVIVRPTRDMDRQRVMQALEETGPIDFEARTGEWSRTDGSQAAGLAAGATGAAATTGARAADTRTTGAPAAGRGVGNESIEVAKERLRIGKREIAQGAVRIRSYVVERPVEEQVRLREEHISVERRPVDRPATPGDPALFQERTLEARSTAEEAVVDKEARIVEEVGLRKEAGERTETVRDTVRETKVEIDDESGRAGTTGRVTPPTSPDPNRPRR